MIKLSDWKYPCEGSLSEDLRRTYHSPTGRTSRALGDLPTPVSAILAYKKYAGLP